MLVPCNALRGKRLKWSGQHRHRKESIHWVVPNLCLIYYYYYTCHASCLLGSREPVRGWYPHGPSLECMAPSDEVGTPGESCPCGCALGRLATPPQDGLRPTHTIIFVSKIRNHEDGRRHSMPYLMIQYATVWHGKV